MAVGVLVESDEPVAKSTVVLCACNDNRLDCR